jgi:hypothetical protein
MWKEMRLLWGNPLFKGGRVSVCVCVCVCVFLGFFFKGRSYIIYCCLKLCKYIYLKMICSLTTKIRKCINTRCITVWVLILQRTDDNTENVTAFFTLRSIKVCWKRKWQDSISCIMFKCKASLASLKEERRYPWHWWLLVSLSGSWLQLCSCCQTSGGNYLF